ncbi:MAG: hypothetical protein E4H36_05425 [Spirochaetales bacterium]|nr:MAG: hypothetical protein E4H36_05425 [Spirochaetales bacterium]
MMKLCLIYLVSGALLIILTNGGFLSLSSLSGARTSRPGSLLSRDINDNGSGGSQPSPLEPAYRDGEIQQNQNGTHMPEKQEFTPPAEKGKSPSSAPEPKKVFSLPQELQPVIQEFFRMALFRTSLTSSPVLPV